MTLTDHRMTRAHLLRAGAVGTLGLYLGGCGSGSKSSAAKSGGKAATLSWMTWADHYLPEQLAAINRDQGLRARPQLITDNAETLLKLKQASGQFDIASADALWVPKFLKDGLIKSFDLNSLQVSKQLYPLAREFPFWKDGSNYMGYPFGWSTQQLYYNTAKVKIKPDSWHALADPKYRKRIVLLNAPTDMMAMAGLATGAKKPYEMTPDEIKSSKAFLQSVKPNVLKLAAQNSDINAALVDGSAWIAFNNLGTELLVKEAGGPQVKVAFPKEGTLGFIDSELSVASSSQAAEYPRFIEASQQAEWIAKNFLKNGRPLFNEKAYKLLVNQGEKERADLLLYNQPEKAEAMLLKGPSGNEQAYVDAYNEVFGG